MPIPHRLKETLKDCLKAATYSIMALAFLALFFGFLTLIITMASTPGNATEPTDLTDTPPPPAYNGGHHSTFFKLPQPQKFAPDPRACITGLYAPRDVRLEMDALGALLQSQTTNGPVTYQTYHRPSNDLTMLFVFIKDYASSGNELGCMVTKFGTPPAPNEERL